jgi:hypothetical protein
MDRSVPVVAERATVPKLPMGRRRRRRRGRRIIIRSLMGRDMTHPKEYNIDTPARTS